MGDTWTEGLPLMWLADYVPAPAASPHVFIILTKRPKRMAEFWRQYGPVPANFWLVTSVTSTETLGRVRDLLAIQSAAVLGVSYEPGWTDVDLTPYLQALQWVVLGGESGADAKPFRLDWATC